MAKQLPPIEIHEHAGFSVVRDDLLPGGTKRRVLNNLLQRKVEYVYAGPVYGHAQIALAYAAADVGAKATLFVAARKDMHPNTLAAKKAGAKIVQVPHGYLSNVQAKARNYVMNRGGIMGSGWPRKLMPFGLDYKEFVDALAVIAQEALVEAPPVEVWCVGGSGTLTRALQKAWPDADHYVIRVGADRPFGKATVYEAAMDYQAPAKLLPPFPSAINYDAKAWEYVTMYGSRNALFWNVAG